MRVNRRGLIFVVELIVLAALVALSLARPGSEPGPSGGPTGAAPTPSSTSVAPSGATPGVTPSATSTGAAIATPVPTSTSVATPVVTPGPHPGANVSGTWSGTWTSLTLPGVEGGIAVTWTQEGADLSGTITMDGESCLNGDIIQGTLSGLHIDFSVVQREATIDYSGTIIGNSMSGTFSTDCDIGQGRWTMRKSS
jgi:hypothetical protein